MRWLNPVGVPDLDGEERAEIAAVITPHIGGTLKVYRRTTGYRGLFAADQAPGLTLCAAVPTVNGLMLTRSVPAC